jgi:flagellar biosynthesis/type III secretory pathway chaperone
MEDEALDRLITILGCEVGLLKDLRDLLAAQQEALVAGKVEDIKQSVEGQISILGEISGLERERTVLVESVRPGGDAGKGDLTLARLMETAPAYGDRLREVRTALQGVLEAIGTLNKHNGMLINQSLAYIGKTLRMIAGEDVSSTVYTSAGEVTCPTGRLAVDRKV